MKWDEFRRSDNIEDFTDPSNPKIGPLETPGQVTEIIKLRESQLAKDAGSEDIR